MPQYITFRCAACGNSLKADSVHQGKTVRCIRCRTETQVPSQAHGAQETVFHPPPLPVGVRTVPESARSHSSHPKYTMTAQGWLLSTGGLLLVILAVLVVVSSRQDTTESPANASAKIEAPALAERTTAAAQPPVTDNPKPASRVPRQLSTEEIVARSEKAVARLKGKFSSGTGFLVRPGLLATNSHVIRSELLENVSVEFPSAEGADRGPVRVALLYEDPARDLAILKVDSGLPCLTIAAGYEFRRGEDVLVIGNPSPGGGVTLENAVSRGVMSTKAKLADQQFYQLGIAINSGNSGGPVLDYKGRVIGVVTLKSTKAEGMAFSIPPEEVQHAITAAASAQPSDLERVRARHRAVAAIQSLIQAASLYSFAMHAYVEHTNNTVRRGGSVQQSVTEVAQFVSDKVTPLNKYLTGDLAPVLRRVSSDPWLDGTVKTKLVDLWEIYREMKDYAENPRGSFGDFSKNTVALTEQYKRLGSSLGILLGVDLDTD